MDVALVKHSEHDVNGKQGRQNQDGFRRQRILEGGGRSLEAAVNGCRYAHLQFCVGDGPGSGPQISARRQVEGDGHRRELSLMVDRERSSRLPKVSKGRERYLCALAGDDVHALQCVRSELVARIDFQHHVVLVQGPVDGGDLALSEGVIENVVNLRWCNSQT